MAKADIVKHQFPKGVSGNPKGRPKKFVTTLKDMGYKVSEVNDTIQALLAAEHKLLEEISKSEDATMLERIIAKALIKSEKEGKLGDIETLLSRVFGYPKASFEQTIMEQPFFPDKDEPKKEENE